MGTLDELIHYCKKEHPARSMVLVGESGCGKTYLIETELREALKDTHFIIRVSLFGINSIAALHDAIKKQWLYSLTPLLSKLSSHPDQIEKGHSFVKALNSILMTIYPQAGNFSSAMLNSLDYIVATPVVEDHITKKEKRVVLVFDDVDRTRLNRTELLGCINDYCENQRFNTILIANREYFMNPDQEMEDFIRAAKEKTVAYTVLNRPDFGKIVHAVLEGLNWRTEEYTEFLKEHEQAILELFASEPESFSIHETDRALIKNHSIRSLITSLESFTAFSITWVEPGSKTLTRISARFSHSILQRKAESAETERLPTHFPMMKSESFIRCFLPASCLTASGSGSASATGIRSSSWKNCPASAPSTWRS